MSNDHEKKLKKLKARLEENPGDIDSQIELGKLYFITSRFDEAIEAYQQVLIKDSVNISACYNLGMAYQAKKMNEESKHMFRKVLKLDPDNKAAQEALDKMVNFQSGGR